MSVIELNDVSVTFHEGGRTVEAVKHVNISVEKGEIFGIVGFSGAGKSTLVRTVNLLERPTGGHVMIDGNDITALKGSQLSDLRKKIGFIFQGFNLITNVTVGKNIEFALKAGGYPKAQWPERVRELLALVGLENKIDSYPSSLSGGQKQRVSIARALANKPEILLCDEATSALDLETTEGILTLLQRINRELGITIVFITHQLDVAKQIFDRVAVMENGVVVEQGNTFDVFSAPKHPTTKALVERYLGIAVPPQLVPSLPAGTIVELRYKGDAALEPLISQVAQDYGVSIDVLHANVEYFGSQAIGILIVLVSGVGEPLLQADAVAELLGGMHARGLHTCVDTAGNVPWEAFEQVLPVTDLFLYDVKAYSPQTHRQWTGVGNERILENLRRLAARADIWIRIPFVPGVNTEQIEDIGRFLTQLPRVRRVEILPYHTLGAEKSAELNRVQRQFPVPDAAACETAEQTLRMLGLPVTSGRAQKKEDKK